MRLTKRTIPCMEEGCPGILQAVRLRAEAQPIRLLENGIVITDGPIRPSHPPIDQTECDTCMAIVDDLPAWIVVVSAMRQREDDLPDDEEADAMPPVCVTLKG